jgi:hypothetical protein
MEMNMTKQKTKGTNLVGRVSKEQAIPVASDSLQTRAPGAGPGNLQSATRAPAMGFGGSEQGERGGPGTQQAGWSSRQQAQRMRDRAEQERQGQAQQSGYGGSQQAQRAGSEESATGPASSMQSADDRGTDRNQAANARGPGANRARSSSKGKTK